MKTTVNGLWIDVFWEKFEQGKSIWLSFRWDLMLPTEITLVLNAVAKCDVDEVCQLWDTFVIRW